MCLTRLKVLVYVWIMLSRLLFVSPCPAALVHFIALPQKPRPMSLPAALIAGLARVAALLTFVDFTSHSILSLCATAHDEDVSLRLLVWLFIFFFFFSCSFSQSLLLWQGNVGAMWPGIPDLGRWVVFLGITIVWPLIVLHTLPFFDRICLSHLFSLSLGQPQLSQATPKAIAIPPSDTDEANKVSDLSGEKSSSALSPAEATASSLLERFCSLWPAI